MRFSTVEGAEVVLDLAEAVHIRDGDAMVLEDGSFVVVQAADEELLEVSAPADELMRLAWHLGNRHLAVQFLPGALRILYDHVIAEMVTGLGGAVTRVTGPFDPESGAYAH
jgi:urease accessory protein